MATQNVSIGIAVSDNGTAKKVVKNFQEIQQAATSAQKAAANIQVPTGGTAGSRAVYAKSAPTGSQAVTEQEYGKVRGTVGTGAAGRDFAKQAQGLGGLVALYATFAANIFAVGAAYEALNKAAGAERLSKATEMMSISTGIHLKAVSKNLVEASGYALSFSEAMQFTNIGTSAGLASAQIESLTKIAKGAANALGRDVGDSVRRIIQGTAKQEQEILDELGIFVKASQAYEKFAAANKIKVADLTGAQRTQAYANEVERLGAKWNDFAEIPDPFSKFAATGKNALNDLLTSINKVFSPLLSFLSESEGAIKAIIILISTSLTKRALPELGSLFSNIFNYDKKIQQNNANAVVTSIRERISQIAKEIEIGNKKLVEASKIPNVTKESIVKSVGVLGAVAPRGNIPGVAGISSTRLSTNILGTAAHPIDISKYREVADIEKVTLKTLREQIKAKEDQVGYTSKLIEQGLLDAESKKGVLILGKEGLNIAQANFAVIDAQNKALLTTNTILTDKLALEKAYNKEQNKLAKALPNSTLPTNPPKITKSPVSSSSSVIVAATTAEVTSISAATAASSRKAAVDAYAAKVSSTYANATEQVTLALRVGTIPALKETIKQMGILLVENNLATAGTGFFANMQIVAAGASRILALALKGVGMAINWVLTPLLIAVTVWELFGDSIAAFLPTSIQATLGIGEQGKAAEEASKRLKEYTEGTELAAMSLNKLNAARAANPETFAESASLNKIEATVVQEQIARIKKLNEVEQERIDLLKLEDLKKRTGLEGTALVLQQLSESTTVTKEESKALQQLVKDRAALDRAIKGNYASEEQRISQAKVLQAAENDLLGTIGIRTQQALASDEKLKASNQLLQDSYLKVVDALKKKGDPSLSLVTPASVDIYNSLNDIFNSTSVTANKFEGAQATLIQMMQTGGKTAAAAAPLYSLLTDAIYAGTTGGRTQGSLVTDLRLVNMYLEQQKDAITKMVANLASATDVKKPSKQLAEYTAAEKTALKGLKNQVEETSSAMRLFDLEASNTAGLSARNSALRGYKTELENLAEAELANSKSSLQYTLDLQKAAEEYSKVLLKSSSTPEDKANAVDRLQIEINSAAARKEAAVQSAEIKRTDADISTTLAKITREYDAQKTARDLIESQEANQLSILEAKEELMSASIDLSFDEITARKKLAEVDKANNKARIAYIALEAKTQLAVDKILASGASVKEAAVSEVFKTYMAERVKINDDTQTAITLANISAATETANKWKETGNSIRDSLVDAFMGAVESGTSIFKAMRDSLVASFKSLVLKPTVQAVMGSITGLGGVSLSTAAGAAGTEGASGSGILGSLGSFGSSALNGLGLAATGFGQAAAATFSNGLVAGFSTNMANIGALASGGSWVTALGAAAPYIGAALAVYSIADSLFGGGGGPKTESSYGSMASLGDTSDKGLAGTYSRGVEDAWTALSKQLDITSQLKVGAFTGIDTQGDAMTQFNASATVNGVGVYSRGARMGGYENVGRSEADLKAAMEEEATRLLFAALKASDLPEQYKVYLNKIADNAEDMTKAISNVTMVSEFTKGLQNLPFEQLKNLSFDAASGLIAAAGGLEQLGTKLGSFYNNYYTEEEKYANTIVGLTKEFKTLGYTLPSIGTDTRAWYKSIVLTSMAMDQSVPANAAATSSLLDLGEALSSILPAIEGITSSLDTLDTATSKLQDLITSFGDFAEQISEFKASLLLGNLSTLTPEQKYIEAKGNFEEISAKVMLGDKDAMSKFTEYSQSFLDASKTMYASSDKYTEDFGYALQKLEQSQIFAENVVTDATKQLNELSTQTRLLTNIDAGIAKLAGINTAATGGYRQGMTLVGELGPELVDFTSPGRVYTADQTAGMFTGGASMAPTLNALVIEVNKLRQEVVQLRKDQQKQTGDIIISNYDANQKASDNVATAVVNSSVDSAWVDRSKATIN